MPLGYTRKKLMGTSMSLDPLVEEIHRHREELFEEFGFDPAALVRHLQAREQASGRPVRAPHPQPELEPHGS